MSPVYPSFDALTNPMWLVMAAVTKLYMVDDVANVSSRERMSFDGKACCLSHH